MFEQLSFAPNGNIVPCPYREHCLNHPSGCSGDSHWCKRVPDQNEKKDYEAKVYGKKLRIPCERYCDVEWCSFVCFQRRGYIWDKNQHSWIYDEKGKAVRTKKRECDWLTDKELEEVTNRP